MDLLTRILAREAHVAVVGLGRVGLELSLRTADAGFPVTGIDIDSRRVAVLSAGSLPTTEHSIVLRQLVESRRFRPTTDLAASSEADVIVICVPTPLNRGRPDLSFVETAAKEISRTLRPGQLVILESTTHPGTTEDLLTDILESSGLGAGTDFFLGYSPERIDPGSHDYHLGNTPKIVAGINEPSTELMHAFYSQFVEQVVSVSSPKAAEMTKLLENTYRHVNIALANEFALLCHDLGIDVWEVIGAAATKPFGFQAFYPGPGWGGHCIPVDPDFLAWRVRQTGDRARFVELASHINKRMPGYVVERVAGCLRSRSKTLEDVSILALGVTYKADVPDLRESPALEVISLLRKAGARVLFHDPFLEELRFDDDTLRATPLTDDVVSGADLVVILTNHSMYDWHWLARTAQLIFDTRNALEGLEGPIEKL